jgi:tetratricopeptide (TPR) repeat protein
VIFTLYSFKGGVGRSMALANLAELLYARGLKVLMLDFDLEAPGLERYFGERAAQKPEEIGAARGVIDMLLSFQELQAYAPPPAAVPTDARPTDDVPLSAEPVRGFVVPIYDDPDHPGTLEILPAGARRSPDFAAYAKRVLSFDWVDFYVHRGGERFFDWLRRELNAWDVVLIDSRTGVTELGGVCTHHLADAVICFLATNEQNLEGTAMMAASLSNPDLAKARGGRELPLLFVPSRVEISSEEDKHDTFAARFDHELGRYFPTWLTPAKSWFVELKLQYVPAYSYLERVAVRERGRASKIELVDAYERLALRMAQIARKGSLYDAYHRAETRNAAARQLSNMPAKNPFFVGREEEIKRLQAMLAAEHTPVVLCGLGGVGKTCLVLEYASRFRQEYDAIFWCRATSEDDLQRSMEDIAGLLGAPRELGASRGAAAATYVRHWMETQDRWLLILDDVWNVESAASWLPPVPRGDVVYTSRNSGFEQTGARLLRLDVLTFEDARTFLQRRLGRATYDRTEQGGVDDLAAELGGLPLALEQAAAQIARRGTRVEDFVASYRRRRLTLLDQQKATTAGRELSVSVVFESAFEQLEPFPAARDILLVSAWLAPRDIPLELFQLGASFLGPHLERPLTESIEDPIALEDVLEPLVKVSLISRHGSSRTFSVHQLVQEATRARMDQQMRGVWRTRAFQAVDITFRRDPSGDWRPCDRLVEHVLAVLKHEDVPGVPALESTRLQLRLASYFVVRKRWEEAERLLAAVRLRFTALSDTPGLVATVTQLATVRAASGESARLHEAEQLLNEVEHLAQSLPPESSERKAHIACAARIAFARGEVGRADRLWQSLFDGPIADPDVWLDGTIGRAAALLKMNQWNQADALVASAIDWASRRSEGAVADVLTRAAEATFQANPNLSSPGVPRTYALDAELKKVELAAAGASEPAPMLGGLAAYYFARSDLRKAEEFLRRVAEIQRQTLGPSHPALASTLRDLASTMLAAGRPTEAAAFLREALAISRVAHGLDSREVADLQQRLDALPNAKAVG